MPENEIKRPTGDHIRLVTNSFACLFKNVMRKIRLSHDEIELIQTALQYVHDTKLDLVSKNRTILEKSAKESIVASAKKYFDVLAVFDGQRDE